MEEEICTFAIIGGGIAGVSCAEGLNFLCPEEKIIVITASSLIKAVTNIVPLSKLLSEFDVKEIKADELANSCPNVHIIQDVVTSLDANEHKVFTAGKKCIHYKKLCICSGAIPKLIAEGNEYVLGIRDTESVKLFQERIKNARRIVVVGNGGIATELVHEIEGIEIIWAIKDKHISATFVDPGAAEFFQSILLKKYEPPAPAIVKRFKYTVDLQKDEELKAGGAALGPDWHSNFSISGNCNKRTVTVEYETEVKSINSHAEGLNDSDSWPLYVELTNGKSYGCDFIVSATGVIPNSEIFSRGCPNMEIAKDGGIKINWKMETSVPDIFAAGDVCTASWERAKHWFQMRLWTQARQMGTYAAKSMAASLNEEEVLQDFCFELFTHVTRFFGYKVVLLGLYNGQTLEGQYELMLRITKNEEYVKLVLKDGRMQGAVLIGETDLEEMCENLILNQLDLSPYGEDLLNPNIDIEDYFD